MSKVIEFPAKKDGGNYKVEYLADENGLIFGIKHPDWPFTIMRDGDTIAFVCDETDEPFGEIDRNAFNAMLACWLIVDDPSMLDSAANHWKK